MLPKIIFFESHWDPITGKILNKLLPHLQSLGYNFFYDEIPSDKNLDWEINLLEEGEQLWTLLPMALEKKFGVQLDHPDALNHPYFLTDQGREVFDFVKRHYHDVTYIEFLHSLKNNNIQYQTIDLEGIEELSGELVVALLEEQRNIQMANAYLDAKHPLFARNGLAHVEELQTKILEKISFQEASQQFLFLNVHSLPPLPYDKNLEEKIRTGALIPPLGITSIDASKKSEDEIVQQIMNQILEKQQLAAKKPEKAKVADSHVTQTIYNLFGNNTPQESQILSKNDIESTFRP